MSNRYKYSFSESDIIPIEHEDNGIESDSEHPGLDPEIVALEEETWDLCQAIMHDFYNNEGLFKKPTLH